MFCNHTYKFIAAHSAISGFIQDSLTTSFGLELSNFSSMLLLMIAEISSPLLQGRASVSYLLTSEEVLFSYGRLSCSKLLKKFMSTKFYNHP